MIYRITRLHPRNLLIIDSINYPSHVSYTNGLSPSMLNARDTGLIIIDTLDSLPEGNTLIDIVSLFSLRTANPATSEASSYLEQMQELMPQWQATNKVVSLMEETGYSISLPNAEGVREIRQWGLTPIIPQDKSVVIPFTLEFPTACLNVVLTAATYRKSSYLNGCSIVNKTTTDFTLSHCSAATQYYYHAVGK